MRKRAEKLDQQRSRFNEETEVVCSGRFFFLFLEQRRGRLVTRSPRSIRYRITSVPQIAIWNLTRPPSTFVSPDPTSRNVRGSVTMLPPHLMIQTNKRAVVPLLSWLPCLQACRQVVRHKPTPRRIEIHSRSLSDVELTATQEKKEF